MTVQDDRTEELRKRYLANQVLTASPAQRLLMVLDQLERDLSDAQVAFTARDIETIHVRLLHAQEILLVLRDSLAGSDWEGAEPLRAVYLFLYNRLVECNVKKDATLIPMCQEIVAKINDANRRAAAAEAATAGGRVA